MNPWIKLWEKATQEQGEPATIIPNGDDEGSVTLVWPDGSRGSLYWHDGDWQWAESLNTAPGDVAARDSF